MKLMSASKMARLPIRPSWRPRHLRPHSSRRTYRTATNSSSGLPIHALIPPGSPNHSTLSTFLAHARRTSLGPSSPIFVGTCFEYHVLASLKSFGFALQRVGRTADNGIDLLGTWTVPSHPVPIRVLLQCKNHARALNPEHVRELEGAFAGAPAGWKGKRSGVMGFLVSPRPASKGVREAVGRSTMPVGYVMVDGIGFDQQFDDDMIVEGGKVRQFLWNKEAQDRGLEGLGVTTRYSPGLGGVGEMDKEVVLSWNGWAIRRLAESSMEEQNSGLSTETSLLSTSVGQGSIITDSSLQTLSTSMEDMVITTPKKRGRPRKDATITTMDEKSKSKSQKKG